MPIHLEEVWRHSSSPGVHKAHYDACDSLFRKILKEPLQSGLLALTLGGPSPSRKKRWTSQSTFRQGRSHPLVAGTFPVARGLTAARSGTLRAAAALWPRGEGPPDPQVTALALDQRGNNTCYCLCLLVLHRWTTARGELHGNGCSTLRTRTHR